MALFMIEFLISAMGYGQLVPRETGIGKKDKKHNYWTLNNNT